MSETEPGKTRSLRSLKKRFKTAYDNLKIKHKLFLLQYLAVLIFGGVCLVGLQFALHLYDGMLYNESAKVLNLSTVNIENALQRVENVSYTVLSHPDIQRYLEKLQTPSDKISKSLIGNALTEILWVYLFEKNIISVNLVDTHGNQYSGGPRIRDEFIKPIINRAQSGEGSAVFIPPFAGESHLICARQVREVRNLSLKPLGTLILRINMRDLVRHSTAGVADRMSNLLIRWGSHEVYASNSLTRRFVKGLVFDNNRRYQVKKLNGSSYFVAHTVSNTNGWDYINILPYDQIFRPIILLRTVIVVIFGILLVGTIFLSMKIARNLTRPIENLSAQMKRVEKGDFSIDEQAFPDVGRADEIGGLQHDFAIMIQKINTLIQEDYTKQIVIKDTQFRALQAQINPHFLYNTMESINWLAKLNGQQEISLMVEALGNLLRSAISNQETVISLEQEMSLLQDYITIQRMRFGERLQFEMKITPEWCQLKVPKLILQPIVENSIRYGLENLTGVCRIRVTAVKTEERLEIMITDNGPGLSCETLRQWERGVIQPRGNGIGLKNINDRLKLIFGDSSGLSLRNREDEGVEARIRIPI